MAVKNIAAKREPVRGSELDSHRKKHLAGIIKWIFGRGVLCKKAGPQYQKITCPDSRPQMNLEGISPRVVDVGPVQILEIEEELK